MKRIFTRRIIYSVLLCLSITIFFAHYIFSGQAVYGDGIGYYAHLRSWVIDGDWNYSNEYKHLYNHENNNSLTPASTQLIQIVATTADGKAENHYSPGVAILLLPFYVAAHITSLSISLFGFQIPVTGYSDVYQIFSGLGAILYVVGGLWLLEEILKKVLKDTEVSRLTIIAIFFATQLLYYGSFDVINSHFASFFLIILFFYLYFLQKNSIKNIFLLGLISGLMTVNRLQDGVVVVIWIFSQWPGLSFSELKIFFKKISIFISGFILSLWPLLYHWNNTFTGIFDHTYIRNLAIDRSSSSMDLFGSFFDPVTGLFTKAPLLALASLYFIYESKRKKMEYILFPFAFFIIQVIIITIQGGWSAAAYGGRMYVSSLIFFAIILGNLLKYLQVKNRMVLYWVVAFFTIINFSSLAYFIFVQK